MSQRDEVKVRVGERTIFFSHSALRDWRRWRSQDLHAALLHAHFGPMPGYVRDQRQRDRLALIVDQGTCFIVKPKGKRYGTAITFRQAPPEPGLKRGFRYV